MEGNTCLVGQRTLDLVVCSEPMRLDDFVLGPHNCVVHIRVTVPPIRDPRFPLNIDHSSEHTFRRIGLLVLSCSQRERGSNSRKSPDSLMCLDLRPTPR